MRVPADRHIRLNCVNCREAIEVKNGLIFTPVTVMDTGWESSHTRNKAKSNYSTSSSNVSGNSHNKWVLLFVLAVVSLLIGTGVYVTVNEDRLGFEKVAENPTVSKLKIYLATKPEEKYEKAALRMKDSLIYHKAIKDLRFNKDLNGVPNCAKFQRAVKELSLHFIKESQVECEECLWEAVQRNKDFASVNMYQREFPAGKYKDSLDVVNSLIWERLYQKYSVSVQEKKIAKSSQKFVKTLLNYAKQTGQSDINIVFRSKVTLKDWKDYSKEEQQLVDMMTSFSNSSEKTSYPLPSDSEPPSIKHNFTKISTSAQNEVVKAFQIRLDSIFLPGTFTVTSVYSEESLKERPLIDVNYKVETLSEKYEAGEFPILYVHTEGASSPKIRTDENGKQVVDYDNRGRFMGYLLATGINWDVSFSIPDNKEKINFKSYSRPNNHFSNVGGSSSYLIKSNVYHRMLSSAFKNYASELADEIGL